MKEIFRSITKVTLAVLLTLILIGCGNSNISKSTLPYVGPSFTEEETKPTLPTNFVIFPSTTDDTSADISEVDYSVTIIEETTTIEEITTVEETTPIETEPETTSVEETTPVETTPAETEPAPRFTFTDMATYMYVLSPVNVRTLPSTEGTVLFSFETNHQVWVTGRCNETKWYRIDIEGQALYISDGYLGYDKVVETQPAPVSTKPQTNYSTGFVYYTVAGQWPERAYEEYLYQCLSDRGIAWWYPYAVAQIWQESRWNPKSTNGTDHGICQFNGALFPTRAAHHAGYPGADIWNPYDSLYVYSFYIRDILVAQDYDLYWTLSFYITGVVGQWNQSYIDAVMGWYYALEVK